jgi:hypothetical protein
LAARATASRDTGLTPHSLGRHSHGRQHLRRNVVALAQKTQQHVHRANALVTVFLRFACRLLENALGP